MKRAVVAAFGWPANLQKDAVYPYTTADSKRGKLIGANTDAHVRAEGKSTVSARRLMGPASDSKDNN